MLRPVADSQRSDTRRIFSGFSNLEMFHVPEILGLIPDSDVDETT